MFKSLMKKIFKKDKESETETVYIPTIIAEAINNNELDICVGNLYSHFWEQEWKADEPENPEWYNQAIYFWKKEEPFEKKSLPPTWRNYNENFFIIETLKDSMNLWSELVVPWFGMSGEGERFCFKHKDCQITLREAYENKMIIYVNPVDITEDTLGNLKDKENYLILVDRRIVEFNNGVFTLENKTISPFEAYISKGMYLMQVVK